MKDVTIFFQPVLIQSCYPKQDICSSIPVESSKDDEWSLFGMNIPIPEAYQLSMCQGVKIESLEVCFAISMCGSNPSIAFNMNLDTAAVRTNCF